MYRYRRWLERPRGVLNTFEVDRDVVTSIIERASASGGGYLDRDDVLTILAAYGIAVARVVPADSADSAAAAARDLGLPVVMKIDSPDVVHKTDVGGVALDLRSEDEVRSAYAQMMQRVQAALPEARLGAVTIERFVKGGRETIIGMSHDPSFGPVLMFGLGGIYVEALRDVTFRVQPVTDIDAHDMVRAIRGVSLLEGVRGEPAADMAAIEEAIQRVSQLVGEHPAIAEMDINPFVAFERGGIALDARIKVLRRGG
jgi:acetyltransferase